MDLDQIPAQFCTSLFVRRDFPWWFVIVHWTFGLLHLCSYRWKPKFQRSLLY